MESRRRTLSITLLAGCGVAAVFISTGRDQGWLSYAEGYARYSLGGSKGDPEVLFDLPYRQANPPENRSTRRGGFAPPVGSEDSFLAELIDENGEPAGSVSRVVTDGVARVPMDGRPTGIYTLAVRVPGSLLSGQRFHYDDRFSQRIWPEWRFGDLDGDNFVSAEEVEFVRRSVGIDLAHLPRRASPYLLRIADFDRDGVVTERDLALASPNVGRRGDSPWRES